MFQSAMFLVPHILSLGITPMVIDMELYGSNEEDGLIKTAVERSGVIGISAMTAQVPHAIEICKKIRKSSIELKRDVEICWGGIHASLLPEQTLKSPLVDRVVIGMGEKSFSGKVHLPDYSFLEMEKYFLYQHGRRNLDIMTSRGCPYRCSFCVNSILKNEYILLPEDGVVDLIMKLKTLYDFKHAFVMDENLFGKIERAHIIAAALGKAGVTWEANITVRDTNKMSDDELRWLAESGCKRLRTGAESGSDRILEILNKGITRQETARARDRILKAGIIPMLSFMIGLPDETEEDKRMTYKFFNECVAAGAATNGPQKFRPYPGSVEYHKLVKKGLRLPESLEDWAKSELFNTV
jgi:anaerobic magnesium-protoporphyrin IX monomethyl ester cyclase